MGPNLEWIVSFIKFPFWFLFHRITKSPHNWWHKAPPNVQHTTSPALNSPMMLTSKQAHPQAWKHAPKHEQTKHVPKSAAIWGNWWSLPFVRLCGHETHPMIEHNFQLSVCPSWNIKGPALNNTKKMQKVKSRSRVECLLSFLPRCMSWNKGRNK